MLFGLFLDLGSPLSSELCAIAGYDWLLLDLEHGAATEDQLLIHLHAIQSTGTAALVRRQSGERMRIGRALDAGADGIMVPRLEDSIAAAEAVSFLPYPPDGVRGVAMRTRGAGLGRLGHADVRSLNETITGIIQVESPGAVRDADAIAALPGVDVLFVGPTDLSHSLGVPGRFDHPAYRAALAAVVAACAEHGKAPGILLYDLSSIAVHRELGFRFIGIGADGALVAQGARAALATVGRPPSG
jgi:4-hydroxy-2-oxoheptanedioate aldolase